MGWERGSCAEPWGGGASLPAQERSLWGPPGLKEELLPLLSLVVPSHTLG